MNYSQLIIFDKNTKLKLPKHYSIALKASVEASRSILEVYQTEFIAVQKDDGSPVTKADIESSQIISTHLKPLGIPIIGEELVVEDYSVRSTWRENWCIDPLDGTRMFLKRNDEFSVNIAHIVNGKSIFGIIASPTRGEILFGSEEYGVYVANFEDVESPENWTKMEPRNEVNNPMTVTCSRSYTHGSGFKYMQILEKHFGELHYIHQGSAIKFFQLANGRADIYPRFAPTMEWDIAAGHAILEALGGDIVGVEDNRPLRYNKSSLYNPHFIAKTKAILSR